MVLVLLLVNPPVARAPARVPLVALDASASWTRAADAAAWRRALRRAHALSDSVLFVGAGVTRESGERTASPLPRVSPAPSDTVLNFSALAQRARVAGRPVVLITDGEIGGNARTANEALPRGSRIEVVPVARGGDIGISRITAPPAALAGDTIDVSVRLIASERALAGGDVGLAIDGRVVADRELPPAAPWTEHDVTFRVTVPRGGPLARLSAVLAIPGDREPRNDTAVRYVRRGERVSAVAVSTAPDFDFRSIVAVLRGALSLPTRARFRVAPGRWVDENGTVVAEPDVRRALAEAQVAVIHGDTTYFGAPRAVTRGALALVVPPTVGGDWYLEPPPPSPVQSLLRGVVVDSLPPFAAGDVTGGAAFVRARTGAGAERVVLAGFDGSRRVVAASYAGMYSWTLRGGASEDALRAIWGATFEWLAERAASSVALPATQVAPRELLPQRPTVASAVLGERPVHDERVRLRDQRWLFLLVVALLCGEWILRRKLGLR